MRVSQSMMYTSLVERSGSNRFTTVFKEKLQNVIREGSVRQSALKLFIPCGDQATVFLYTIEKENSASRELQLVETARHQ